MGQSLVNQIFDTLTLLNFLSVLLITGILIRFVVSHPAPGTGFTREAYVGFLVPLTIGSVAWSLEWALKVRLPLGTGDPKQVAVWNAYLDYSLNTVVSWCFLLAGCNLFGFKQRIHPALPAETRHALRMSTFAEVLGSRWLPWIALAGMLGALFISCQETASTIAASRRHIPDAVLSIQDVPVAAGSVQDITAAVGLFILGCGLLFTLTRERAELVSGICSATVILYAVLQLATSWRDPLWTFWTRTLALILKATLLVAVGSFITLVRYARRVRREERATARRERAVQSHAAQKARAGMLMELHRVAGSAIARIMTDSQAAARDLREKISGSEYHAVGKRLDNICAGASAIRDFMSRLQSQSPPPVLSMHDVRERLDVLKEHGMRVVVEIDDSLVLKDEVWAAIAEIIFEAVRNIEKWAHAKAIRVSLNAPRGDVLLVVEDDGVGMDASRQAFRTAGHEEGGSSDQFSSGGFGLEAMRRTARLHGGSLEVLSTDNGTRVELVLPQERDER